MTLQRIYIFNPENDLALAYGKENYTAPPLATQLRYDLQMLPLWYAEPESKIYANDVDNQEWLSKMCKQYEISVSVISDNNIFRGKEHFSPWGWSLDMRKRLLDKKVNESRLPSIQDISKVRKLSHRSSSIYINKALCSGLEATQCTDFESVKNYAGAYPLCYIKAPWSSSGKGVFHVLDKEAIDFERWTRGILKRQGSVMCECELDNRLDFAMEFYSDGSKVKFVGYSVFENDRHCSFDKGVVASTPRLEHIINESVGNDTSLPMLRKQIIPVLETLIDGGYVGYFGVDMMVHSQDGTMKINPCVELNLRMTMGCVTAIFAERYMDAQAQGIFRVEYYKSTESLLDNVSKLQKLYSPVYCQGKLMKGLQLLSPIYATSRYCAYVLID